MRPRTIVTDDGIHRSPIVRDTACGKVGYANRKNAHEVAARVRRETGENIRAYHCPRGCHCWHIGHPPGQPRYLVDLEQAS